MDLSMKPDIFKNIHPDAFVIPTNPGPAPDPVLIAAASTATKIADIYKAYALESAINPEFVTAEQISVKLAIDSMSELYYKSLKNTYTGYAGVTLRQLLDHLVTTYATIDQFDCGWGSIRGIRGRPLHFKTGCRYSPTLFGKNRGI